MTRIIHYSNENGGIEGIYVTEDLKTDAKEFIHHNCTVDNDFTIDDDFPATFPLDYNLERKY